MTPHTLRHTCAMNLLHSGADVATIALWLGHSSTKSTDVYLHADLTLKEQALAGTAPTPAARHRYRPPDNLLSFLEGLAAVCCGIQGGCLADPAGAAAVVPRQVLGSELRRAPVVRRRRQPPSSPRLWDPRRPWRGGGPHGPHQARTPGGRQPIARPEGHRPSLAHGTPPTSSIRFVAGVRLRGRETGSQCSEGGNGDIGKDHRIVSRVGERRHDLETSGSRAHRNA